MTLITKRKLTGPAFRLMLAVSFLAAIAGALAALERLAVHDVGRGPAVLRPGMVFANEPLAVYFAENLGVRIENTVLITAGGCENLTDGIPREVRDIEEFMKNK